MTTTMTGWFARARNPLPRSTVRQRHAIRVKRLAEHLRTRRPTRSLSIQKRAVSHVVPKRDDRRHTDDKIDISDLDEIIDIDPVARTCTAQPGVTFVALTEETLRHGLVPVVVPELKTITIGGAVSGCSIESMSFRYGGFHDSCREYEIVTACGEVLRCTRDNENALVFEMMHGSFGTLGILTKLTFDLVPAKPFVHVQYDTFTTLADYRDAIRAHFESEDVDFMDGIVHSPTHFVLSLGTFVDDAPYQNRYDWMKVYWQSTAERREDYLATADYFFRYDRGVTKVHPASFLGRLVFGKVLGSDRLLQIANRWRRLVLPKERPSVVVDVFLPCSTLDAFFGWYCDRIGHFPLWCVPYRRVRDYAWLAPETFAGVDDDLFIDFGIYGAKQPPGRNLYRELEEVLQRVRGVKTLISYNYYEEEAFWRIFHKENYAAVKKRVDPANVLRDLYTKTCRASRGLD